jgi:hypothetical protein
MARSYPAGVTKTAATVAGRFVTEDSTRRLRFGEAAFGLGAGVEDLF